MFAPRMSSAKNLCQLCRHECSHMMVQIENFLWCKCLLGRCICECYARDADVWTSTHGNSKIHCSIFVQKQVILFNLEFWWSLLGTLPSEINLVFQKVWLNEPGSIFKNFTIWLEMGSMKAFSWFSSWVLDHWTPWKYFFGFGEFQINSMLL